MGIESMKIGDLMSKNDNKGYVLLFTDPTKGHKNADIQNRPDLGIYNGSYLKRDDFWANKATTARLIPKLVKEMNGWLRDDKAVAATAKKDEPYDPYAILQWQTTDITYPLQAAATAETNPSLYSYGVNMTSPEKFPTVILQDAVGLTVTDKLKEEDYNPRMQALAIGLNLYMASQNCAVSPDRAPFQPKK